MKAIKQRKTLKRGIKTQVKRDQLREKAIQEMKRQSDQEFYLIEKYCFDYCF